MRFAYSMHYATKSGNPGSRRGYITAKDFGDAHHALSERCRKAGRSKLDLTIWPAHGDA